MPWLDSFVHRIQLVHASKSGVFTLNYIGASSLAPDILFLEPKIKSTVGC